MINDLDMKELKELVNQLESYFYEWSYDKFDINNEDLDYEDIKKNIYSIQREIKNIVERWEI